MILQQKRVSAMANDEDEEKPAYSVGYKKTPVATRFKPGQCGNPKGRPKGARNLTTVLESEINALIPYIENGKRKKMTKLGASVRQAVNKAAGGDLRALLIILNEIRLREGKMKSFRTTAEQSADQKLMPPLTIENAASTYREVLKNAQPPEN